MEATTEKPRTKSPRRAEIEKALRVAKRQWGDRPMRLQDYVELMEDRPDYVGPWTIKREFGNWTQACRAVGLKPALEPRLIQEARWLELVAKVCRKARRPLSTREFDAARPAGTPTADRLAAIYGGWHELIVRSGAFNAEEVAHAFSEQLARHHRS